MLLTYANLKIRDAMPDDAELLCRWWNDGRVMAHAGLPLGLNTNPNKIRDEISTDSDDTFRRLIIEMDSAPIGEMSFRNKGGGKAEIGIKICEFDKQEKGYGTILLKMLISDAFRRGYQKIILDTNVKNARARHVYEKSGFRKVRIDENSWKDQLGRPQSFIHYELSPSDFIFLTI